MQQPRAEQPMLIQKEMIRDHGKLNPLTINNPQQYRKDGGLHMMMGGQNNESLRTFLGR